MVENSLDKKRFAVKAFRKEKIYATENGKESLINEITLMRQLDHPNILKLYEVYETDDSMYLILELIKGGNLLEIIKLKKILK